MSAMVRIDEVTTPLAITLTKGMGWVLYRDKGPSGLAAQSMDNTCPHAFLATFPTEDAMREALGSVGAAWRKADVLMWGVVGEYTAGGIVWIHQN